MQFDCAEFFQTLLEHFWKELSLTDSLNETVFGGLYQETYKCECGHTEKHPLHKLPDIRQIPICGNSTQTCLDAFSPMKKSTEFVLTANLL